MGIVEYPAKAFHVLKRQQLLTLAIALEDQRDRALAEAEELRAQVDALTKELEQATLYCSRPDGVCLRKRWTNGGA